MPDYDALDRYFALRRPGWRGHASALAKSLLPTSAFAVAAVTPAPGDILLLHPHAAARARHAPLAAALEALGLGVREEVVALPGELLRGRRLREPRGGWHAVPRRWRPQAGYAAWLAERFRARLLVTFMDDSVHTPFLREAQHAHGGVLANVAHAAVWPNLDFSMCDADWLLLWGRRSLDNLRAAPLRFGSTRVLLAGSIYLRGEAHAPTAAPGAELRVLFIGQHFDSAHRAGLERDARMFAGGIAAMERVRIMMRTHPLDRGELRACVAPLLPHASWSDAARPLSETLREADVAVASFSSGLLEAAAHGVPIVALGPGGLAEPLGLREHGLSTAADASQLRAALEDIRARHGEFRGRALALAHEHFARPGDATAECAQLLALIARGGDPAAHGYTVHEVGAR
jgi:hypothetical protein